MLSLPSLPASGGLCPVLLCIQSCEKSSQRPACASGVLASRPEPLFWTIAATVTWPGEDWAVLEALWGLESRDTGPVQPFQPHPC